ncbi:MAG: response regulator [SAR202 cluster bacterium]|nr:response regulator [SAR202 cluster bacterium]
MTQVPAPKLIEILMVEDNPGDVRLTYEILKMNKRIGNLTVARDGEEAMAALKRQGRFAETARPDLILLDLNLPKKSGHEILAEIKADPNFRRIPVIVLTSSTSEHDIQRTYEMHANCYISKPFEFVKYREVLKTLQTHWLDTVTLPSE